MTTSPKPYYDKGVIHLQVIFQLISPWHHQNLSIVRCEPSEGDVSINIAMTSPDPRYSTVWATWRWFQFISPWSGSQTDSVPNS